MRIINRVLALLWWSTVLAGSLLVSVEIVLRVTRRPAWVIDPLAVRASVEAVQYTDRTSVAWAAGLLLVGVLLLGAQLRPRPPDTLPTSRTASPTARLDRRGVQRRLVATVETDRDVIGARARLGRRRARVRAEVATGTGQRDARARLAALLRDDLAALGLDGRVRPRVRVAQGKERVR